MKNTMLGMNTINQANNITIFTTYTSYTIVSAITEYLYEINMACICTARCHTVLTISRIRNKTTEI